MGLPRYLVLVVAFNEHGSAMVPCFGGGFNEDGSSTVPCFGEGLFDGGSVTDKSFGTAFSDGFLSDIFVEFSGGGDFIEDVSSTDKTVVPCFGKGFFDGGSAMDDSV
jgi:hypothetical protein